MKTIFIEPAQFNKTPLMQLGKVGWWKFWNSWWLTLITGGIKRVKKGHKFNWPEEDAT